MSEQFAGGLELVMVKRACLPSAALPSASERAHPESISVAASPIIPTLVSPMRVNIEFFDRGSFIGGFTLCAATKFPQDNHLELLLLGIGRISNIPSKRSIYEYP